MPIYHKKIGLISILGKDRQEFGLIFGGDRTRVFHSISGGLDAGLESKSERTQSGVGGWSDKAPLVSIWHLSWVLDSQFEMNNSRNAAPLEELLEVGGIGFTTYTSGIYLSCCNTSSLHPFSRWWFCS